MAIDKPRRGVSEETNPAHSWISDCRPHKCEETHFCCLINCQAMGLCGGRLANKDTMPSFVGLAETSRGLHQLRDSPVRGPHHTSRMGHLGQIWFQSQSAQSQSDRIRSWFLHPLLRAIILAPQFLCFFWGGGVGLFLLALFCLLSTLQKHTESLISRGLLPPRPCLKASIAFAANDLNC